MKFEGARWEQRSFWQQVFSQSKVNGAPYEGENLTHSRWRWPTNTYLQRRRNYLKSSQLSEQRLEPMESAFYHAMRENVGALAGDFNTAAGAIRAS
ncbi:MAG: hypothetical protein ACREO5_01505 [Candidatus Binatia bacterium]